MSKDVGRQGDDYILSAEQIESYLHSDAINDAFGVSFVVPDHMDANGKAVPKLFSDAMFAANPVGNRLRHQYGRA